ncbi:hypothetical protein C5Y96_16065 [Blastopirellula marina]|uniref:RHS repeat-associated core domain-containing protein n=1 Tax=Blastopirellula marina TaxID=124 RepID=A0A2S8F8C2_9BACT|nr:MULTISPECIES: RHS repeat-associated core domain-containing protein [Pirellulaceae]PQO28401.1 hypothetical protein C5Y96_16065 [Blastopirellula marina]RCS49107.1 RHS repeat-associated core domain-containing protein [Bremerella cremea]
MYDQAGNLTVQPQPDLPSQSMEIRYDAWNRPAYIKSGDDQVLLEYDGFGRILAKHSNIPGTSDSRFTRYTYSPDWQLLEEDVLDYDASAVLDSHRYEYIWGVRGPNDLVCREKYDSDDTLLERQYALSDINGNVVGVVPDAQATLDQLITYDPYGTPSGEEGFQHLFGGYYYDSTTGLYLVRNRVYHPKLGRWLTKDPLGMVDGPNLYEYCAGDPVNLVDPSGEAIPLLVILGGMALFGAVAGGTSYTVTTDEFRAEEFALFTAGGAVAGGLGGAAFFGAAFGLSALGFTATYSGLLAGGISGGVGGFSGGFVTTTGMHRFAGDDWGTSLQAGIYGGIYEGAIGTAGGLAGGAVLARYGAGFLSTIASGSAGGIVSGGISGYAENGTFSGTVMGALRGSAMGASFAFGGRVTGKLAGRIKPLPRQPAGLEPRNTATGKLMIGTRAVNESVRVLPRSAIVRWLVAKGVLAGRVTNWPRKLPLHGNIAHHQKPVSLGGADVHWTFPFGRRVYRWGNMEAVSPSVHKQSHPLPPRQSPETGVLYY